MKQVFRYLCWIIFLFGSHLSLAQLSSNTVNYQLTYNATTARYTAWVVPNYATPNAINGGTTEKGGTAQFTVKVPSSFSITSIQDINGTWEKNPIRLGPGNPPQVYTSPLNAAYNYFVIGKSPNEIDYGTFTSGVPVPLFSFTGSGCFGELIPLPPGDPFITAADNDLSLNVANSFYSRSAQPAGGNQNTLEQFSNITGPAAQCAILQANPNSNTLTAGTPTSISVLTNDTNNGLPLAPGSVTVTVSTPPAAGTATVNPDGTISYAPAPGFSGPVSLTYTICAPTQTTLCSSAAVSLTVNAVVIASPDQNTTASGTPVITSILANDTRNGQPASTTNVTVTLASQPANGTAVVNANGTVTYTPTAGFSGVNSFSYTICDIAQPSLCSTTTVSLTVVSTVVATPNTQTLTAGVTTTIPVLVNDTRNGQPASTTNVTVTVSTPPTAGTATVNPDGTISYAPAPGFSGPVSLTYTICDILQPAVCSSAAVSLTVNAVVVASPDQSTTASGTPVITSILANDTRNGQPAITTNVTVTLASQPANGTAVVNANGTVTYTPAAGFSGVNSFSYTICDIAQPSLCSTTTVVITVQPSRPIGVNDINQTVKNTTTLGNVLTNDSETAGLLLTVTTTPVTSPTNGTVTISSTGSYTYTPAANFVGTDSFVYQVCNTAAQCTTALATVEVRDNAPNANDLPVAQNDQAATTPNTSVTIAVKANDSDPDGQPLGQPIIVSPPTNGNLTVNPDGTITYTPVGSFVGTDSFVYQVCDNGSPILCDQATVTVTVRPNPAVNQTLAYEDAYSTSVNQPVSGNVLANDQDLEGNTQTVTTTPVVGPVNGTVTLTASGSFTYTPAANFTGTDSFIYRVCDNGSPSACDVATVYVTTFPPNGAVDLSIAVSQPVTSLTATLVSSLPISVSNVGTGNYAGPVSVTLTLPANVSVAPGFTTSNGFTCTVSGQLVTCVKSVSLAPATSETLTIPIIPGLPTVGLPLTFTANTAIPAGDATPATNATTVTTGPVAPAPLISLLPQVYLQGALFGVTASTLMRDDLRAGGYLPLSHPYATWTPITAVGPMAPSVTAVTGANAIVDWVFVELRSAANGSTVVDSRAALLQRDGDIVGVDGVSALTFGQALSGSYYVAVRHRNHLGVMSQTALPLSATTTVVDFRTPITATFTYTGTGSYTQVTVDQAQVVVQQGVAMWAGNCLNDNASTTPHNFVIYQGTNNDVNLIYQQTINAPTNILVSPFFKLKGYYTGDVNLNGETIFQGTNNDVEFIYQNIIKNHPGNSLKLPFFTIREQLL